MNCCCRTSMTCFLAAILAGGSSKPLCKAGEALPTIQLVANQAVQDGAPYPRLAGLISASEVLSAKEFVAPERPMQAEASSEESSVWAFPSDCPDRTLLRLPIVDDTPTSEIPASKPSSTEEEDSYNPIASLLPPQPLEATQSSALENNVPVTNVSPIVAGEVPKKTDLSTAEQELVEAVIRDYTAATTGALTDQRLNEIATSKIRRAYAMANRGGYYAARQELIEVLRMISQAKDVMHGGPERTEALASGLRALEEAEDFSPRGTQLEADLAIDVICASHRTPIAKQLAFADVLPHQIMNGYFRYAQLKLAAAVAGEPAGSMALHALGKLASQLGKVEPAKHRLALRHAVAYQQAALLAHNQNHLAAHELATLLAGAGHFPEAEMLLRQVASRDPNAVVLRNLSYVQSRLGLSQQASANRTLADQMAQNGASGTNNVLWVSPQAFARNRGGIPPMVSTATNPRAVSPVVPPRRSPPARAVWR